MTNDTNVPGNRTRSRLKKGGLALVGVAGIGALATLTASQWTDEAAVEGGVTTGTFEITISEADLGFTEFAPGDTQTYTGTLTNSSSETADITLTETGLPEGFTTSVTADGTDMQDGGVIELAPGGTAPVTIEFTLPADSGNDTQGQDVETSFTFLGEQQIDTTDETVE